MKKAMPCICKVTAATNGYPPALLRLNRYYNIGLEVYRDINLSAEYEEMAAAKIGWFQQQASFGYPRAQTDLGICYKLGIGVTQYFEQAEIYKCYSQGIGVTKDKDRSIHWLCKAAGQNHSLAQAWLLYYRQTGKHVAKNVKEAVRLYHLAITKGCAFAEEKLASCYLHGIEDEIKQSDKQAVEWLLLTLIFF